MDKLNNYFEKAKELKLDKELIDIQNFDSIIKKKSIKKNLIKGTVVMSIIKGTVIMSILTIIILGITLLLPNEKENLKDFNPETMRRLPIFHLTIEEFENLNIVNIPKTYEEYQSYKDDNLDSKRLINYIHNKEFEIFPIYSFLKFNNAKEFGTTVTCPIGEKIFELDKNRLLYFNQVDISRIRNMDFEFKFIKNEFFEFKKGEFESLTNLVPLSLYDSLGYISDFVVFAYPNKDLLNKLPNRYKDIFNSNFKISNNIEISKVALSEFEKQNNLDKKNEVEFKISELELSNKELKELGIIVENKEVTFEISKYFPAENKLIYARYEIGQDGNVKKTSKLDDSKNIIFPISFHTFKYIVKQGKDIEAGTLSYYFSTSKNNELISNLKVSDKSNEKGLKVKYNKTKIDNFENLINNVIPIKFKTKSESGYNSYIFWFEITDEFISKLPIRYQKRFNKEIELYQQVLDNTKELKDLCSELEEESLLGLCINESINNINLYPNPAKSNIKIELDLDIKKEVLIKLFDVSGKEISSQGKSLSKGKNTIEYDVSKISSGIYIVNIFNGDEVMFSRNIIIE